jgi:DNA polymerase-3 subunit alpha
LFGDSSEEAGHSLVPAREWTEDERLVHEKAALGFYLSGHPTRRSRRSSRRSSGCRCPIAAQKGARVDRRYRHFGAVQSSRRGKMAIVTLDDGGASVEVVIYNEVFDAARTALREDQLVVFEAKSHAAQRR